LEDEIYPQGKFTPG